MQVTADPQGAITETSKENNEARSSHLVLPPEANQARSHVILESSFNSQNPTGRGSRSGMGTSPSRSTRAQSARSSAMTD